MPCARGVNRREGSTMSRPRTVLIAAVLALALGAGLARAQLVITDPVVTLRDAVTAALKEQLLSTLAQEVDRVRRMATRLSASTSLATYAVTGIDVPMWRIHLFQGEQFLYANPYNAALNYGDGSGTAYEEVARPRQQPGTELTQLAELAPSADAAVAAELATLDADD